MSRAACSAVLACICCATGVAHAQADSPSMAFLSTALKAFGVGSVQDATLTVTARRVAGSTDVTVPATLTALTSGTTQLTYQTSPVPLTETRIVDVTGIWTGSWTDPQGATHLFAYHNMLTEPDWFFPVLTVLRALNNTGNNSVTISYMGAETFHEMAVQHLRITNSAAAASQITGLGQSDLYLDAVTLLPAVLTFNDHPDKNVLVDIPVTTFYSGYATQSGVLIPTHIQQFRNNALALDLQIQSVALNTGVNITAPAVR